MTIDNLVLMFAQENPEAEIYLSVDNPVTPGVPTRGTTRIRSFKCEFDNIDTRIFLWVKIGEEGCKMYNTENISTKKTDRGYTVNLYQNWEGAFCIKVTDPHGVVRTPFRCWSIAEGNHEYNLYCARLA